jgi:protein tyrosine/serine phosphatase
LTFKEIWKILTEEHNFINLFWNNFHKIDKDVYRSAQILPWKLKKIIKKYKIKTVINLRDKNNFLYKKEKEICEKMGVEYFVVKISSRELPNHEEIEKLIKTFEKAKKPLLIHCKAGADRTSLASFLYLYLQNKKEEAKRQFSFFKYGHIKYSKAGIIDFCAENLLKENPKNLILWCKNNKEKIEKQFKPKKLFSFINDYIFRRE